MSKAIIKRINKAFGLIYDMGDSGLDYLDKHYIVDEDLIQCFYDEKLATLTKEQLEELAWQLEMVAEDALEDLETI